MIFINQIYWGGGGGANMLPRMSVSLEIDGLEFCIYSLLCGCRQASLPSSCLYVSMSVTKKMENGNEC